MLMAFEAVGHFNAANQITQTSSTIIPIVMLTVLPVFSRSFKSNPSEMRLLTDQTLKYLLIIIFLFAFIVTVTARKIIVMLYGPGFESAVPVLQIIIWTQIFVAADSVMIQSMIASDNERAMVHRSAAGVFVNITLTVLFGSIFGILGIAVSVVLARAILFVLNLHFVRKNIYKTNLMQAAAKPFLCAILTSLFALLISDYHLFLILPIATSLYIFLLFVFKVITENELAAICELSRHVLGKYIKGFKV
jgi:O-antigen/teichoic acid export membrane protein